MGGLSCSGVGCRDRDVCRSCVHTPHQVVYHATSLLFMTSNTAASGAPPRSLTLGGLSPISTNSGWFVAHSTTSKSPACSKYQSQGYPFRNLKDAGAPKGPVSAVLRSTCVGRDGVSKGRAGACRLVCGRGHTKICCLGTCAWTASVSCACSRL